jgi:hypothetical protein
MRTNIEIVRIVKGTVLLNVVVVVMKMIEMSVMVKGTLSVVKKRRDIIDTHRVTT